MDTAYDATQRRAVRDPRGFITEYDSDAAGRPAAQRERNLADAVVYEQTWSYDDAARTERWTDRRGMPTVTSRDGLRRVRTIVRGSGSDVQAESSEYDGNGSVVRVVDANGHATESAYDGANRKRSETRGAGTAVAATTAFTYDAAGNRTETKGPRGAWPFDVRETYDDLNRSVRTEVPTTVAGTPYAISTRAFDGAGNKLCEKRPLGGDPLSSGAGGMTADQVASAVCTGEQVTRYAYDELSKLVAVLDANGGEHSFVYDEVRNLLAKQDANGSLTTYGYDRLNRRTDEWQHLDAHARVRSRGAVPDGAVEGPASPSTETGALHWYASHDANGNVTERTDPKGVTVAATYGVLNRLETETYPEPFLNPAYPYPLTVTYAYDGNGNVELVTERKRTAADATVDEVKDPEYDGLGRLTSERRYDGKVVTYGYDAKGNRTLVRDPDGVETTYTYDAKDRLETATTPEGTASYQYWPDGLLKGKNHPNGLVEARCYDAATRLTALVTAREAIAESCASPNQMVSRYDYEYDLNENRSRQLERRTDPVSQLLGGAEETRYGYDGLDQLVGVAYPDATATLYRLDPVGNRTGERRAPMSAVAALTVAAFAALSPGDALADVTATFNRADWLLTQVDSRDASRNATYGYDLAGNLTQKQKGTLNRAFRWSYRNTLTAVLDGGVEVGRYDYDAELQRVKRTTASEQVEYVLDERHVLQEAYGAQAGHPSYRHYHYAGGPLAVVESAWSRVISTDGLGSTTDLTNNAAAVTSMRKYDAWGRYRNDTAPTANQPKLGFTGHQFDPETGLVYARARYYDPEMGRFLSRDSYEGALADAPSLHRFAYVRGNPLRFTDPTGLRDMAPGEAAREAEWFAEYQARRAQWEKLTWYEKFADFFRSDGYWQGTKILARNINKYREAIREAADREAVVAIDVAAEYGEGPTTIRLPSGDQTLSRGPLVVPASKVEEVLAQRARNREQLSALRAGPASSLTYAVADATGASSETKFNASTTAALFESTLNAAKALSPGGNSKALSAQIRSEGGILWARTPSTGDTVKTPWADPWTGNEAVQAPTPEARAVAQEVAKTRTIYRVGQYDVQNTFPAEPGASAPKGTPLTWAPENPALMDPGLFARRYGFPLEKVDWIEIARLRENATFVTRAAGPYGGNPGGAFEVVVEPTQIETVIHTMP